MSREIKDLVERFYNEYAWFTRKPKLKGQKNGIYRKSSFNRFLGKIRGLD